MTDFEQAFIREKLGSRCTYPFTQWLNEIGYFVCPASKGHHGNYRSGLYEHSVAVAEELQNLTDRLGLTWQAPTSPWVVGLLHDICKTDDYEYNLNSDDLEIKFNPGHPGHGMKSVYLLAGHFNLTNEEKACIQYHMGAYTDKEDWKYLNKAIDRYPNVLYTHMADMIASHIKGI